MKTSSKRLLFLALASAIFTVAQAISAEQRLTSPDSKLAIIVSDTDGLHYRVEVDGKRWWPILSLAWNSRMARSSERLR